MTPYLLDRKTLTFEKGLFRLLEKLRYLRFWSKTGEEGSRE